MLQRQDHYDAGILDSSSQALGLTSLDRFGVWIVQKGGPYGRAATPLTVRAVNPFWPFTSTSILLQAAGGAVSFG